jgi:VCBS repeat-containing protein
VDVNPAYNEAIEYDAAILHLAEPVTGIRPVPVASGVVPAGSAAVIVGFGRTGGDLYEYGIKRQGQVMTTACSPELGTGKLCWAFDGSAAASESNVCHGDSGGSTYLVTGGVPTIVGVHSTTNQMSCLEAPGTFESADTSVYDHRDFITDRAEEVLAEASCGDLPVVGDASVTVAAESGRIEIGQTADFTIEVPRGTAELRVALNSTDGAGANLDLYLKAGEPASPSFADCAAAGDGAHGYCQVDSPAPGTWYVQVIAPGREGVGGDFQMTATSVGGAPLGVDDTYRVGGDSFQVDAAGGVLANDEGTARGALAATVDQAPAHGQLELAADGSFHYQAESGYVGEDSFTYLASDGTYQGPATVILMVGTGEDGGMVGGCSSGGGSGWPGAGLVMLLLAASLRISRVRCASGRR